MHYSIDSNSSQPIYRQLTQQIREGVARGRLAPETQLPSVREMSKALVINPNTVSRVYTELEREGVLTTRPGLGVFVAQPKIELTKAIRVKRIEEMLREWLTSAVYLGFTAEDVRALLDEHLGDFQWDLVKGKK